MPPKKGKGKGKKKDKDEEEKELGPHPAMDHVVREFDVRTYHEKIGRLEGRNTDLMRKVSEQKDELEQTKADQADVYVYLHKKLDDNFDVIAGLEARILDLETEKDRIQGNATREIEALTRKLQGEIDELQRENRDLRDNLLALQEFKEHKEAIEATMQQLRADLASEKRHREEEVAELERRNVASKDKLKKEMFMKIKETKKNILSSTEDQLHDTTKRTMAENSQMTTELQYQSKETEKLIAINAKLADENNELRREHSLAEQTQQELVKRTHFYQRLIKKLNERIKVAEERERDARHRASEAETGAANAEDVMRKDSELELMEKRYSDLRKMFDASREEADEREAEYQRWLALQDETVQFMLVAIDDVKRQAAAKGGMHARELGDGARLDRLPPAEREKALQLLLAKMQLFQATLQNGDGPEAGGGGGLGFAPGGGGGVMLPPIGPGGVVGEQPSATDSYGVGVGPGASVSLESVGGPVVGYQASVGSVGAPYSTSETVAAHGSVMMIGAVPPKPMSTTVGTQTLLTGARPALPGDLRGSEGGAGHGGGKDDGSPRLAEATGEPSHVFAAYGSGGGGGGGGGGAPRRGSGGGVAGGNRYRASTLRGVGSAPQRPSRDGGGGGDGRMSRSPGMLEDGSLEGAGGRRSQKSPRTRGVAPPPAGKPRPGHRPGPVQSGVGFSNELTSIMGRPPLVATDAPELGIVGVHKDAPGGRRRSGGM